MIITGCRTWRWGPATSCCINAPPTDSAWPFSLTWRWCHEISNLHALSGCTEGVMDGGAVLGCRGFSSLQYPKRPPGGKQSASSSSFNVSVEPPPTDSESRRLIPRLSPHLYKHICLQVTVCTNQLKRSPTLGGPQSKHTSPGPVLSQPTEHFAGVWPFSCLVLVMLRTTCHWGLSTCCVIGMGGGF